VGPTCQVRLPPLAAPSSSHGRPHRRLSGLTRSSPSLPRAAFNARRRIHAATSPLPLPKPPPHRSSLRLNGGRRCTRAPPPCRPSLSPSLPYIRAAPSPAPLAPLLILSSLTQRRHHRSCPPLAAARRRSPTPPRLPPLQAPW
jgi:hypothetical protein